jgi:hypothetical protein
MSTFLPQDSNGNPIPVLRFKINGAHAISASVTSARNSTAFADETRVISLYATQPVYIKFGDSSVTATSANHYFPAGVYYDVAIGGDETAHATHIAVLAVSTSGTVYISEKA